MLKQYLFLENVLIVYLKIVKLFVEVNDYIVYILYMHIL